MVGCCGDQQYGAGCGGGAYDISLYHSIMVKFRPIAPKPVTGSESGAGDMNNNNNNNNNIHFRKFKAKKRRYVRLNSKNTKRSMVSEEDKKIKKTETSTESSSEVENKKEEEKEKEKEVVTLSLMPETPDPKQTLPPFNQDLMITFPQKLLTPMRNPFSYVSSDGGGGASDPVGTTVGSSYVIVESVTDTCEDAKRFLGSTDEERWMNLDRDTCPGFISDAHNNRVRWTNEAYRLLVGQARPEMVWLVTKRRLPPIIMYNHHQGFGCRVKLQYTWKNERKSMVVPCDVWRINGGDLAWRLDVLSALSLGR